MSPTASAPEPRARRNRLAALALPLIAAALLSACGSGGSKSSSTGSSTGASTGSSSSGSGSGDVKTGTAGGATVLVNSNGMTLYHLTAETGGKFICTGACLQIWHPLTVSGKPTGSVGSLSTIKRPDGTVQVTYKGEPLYTFAKDTSAGQAGGQGIKDVGTWQDITTGAKAAPAPASNGGYSSGY